MVQITRKALDRIKYDGMSAIVDRLAYAMSIAIELKIAALYNATANAALPNSQVVFGGSTLTTIPSLYPGGHGSGTIVAADVMSGAVLSTAVAKMQQYDNVPFPDGNYRSEEHTSELQSPDHLLCRLLLEKKKKKTKSIIVTSM